MRTAHAVLGAAFALTAAGAMAAEPKAPAYPVKPIRVIVPFSPGGSADNLMRTLQPGMASVLGQPLVLDNRAGASSVIGTEIVARAAPDGYTILLITTTHTVNPSMMKKLPFDPANDFAGITLAVSQPNILVVHPSVPAKSVKELVALGKTKGPLTFASGGNGSSPHLSGELLRMIGGIDLTHVPYKGSGPGLTAVLGGQVTMMFLGPLAVDGHIKSGKLRALAVASNKRTSVFPDLPTMAEAGYAGIETGTWYGLLAPARTPPAVLDTLHASVVKTMASAEMKPRLVAQGVDIVGSSPREFDKTVREEIAKWSKIVKQAGIQAE
jgi:tripartite-type tricarboxylate transporter receptor subunit TctC